MKTLFKLALVLLVAHALFRFVPPYWHFTEFRWDLKASATAWREHSDDAVVQEVLRLAAAHDVPLTAENVRVRREPSHLFIDVDYSVPIEFVPGSKRDWRFGTSIDAWTLDPRTELKAP